MFFICILLINLLSVNAQLIISDDNIYYTVNKGISYSEEKLNTLSLADVIKQNKFIPVTSDVPNFGISTSSFWLRIQVKNITHHETFRLQVAQPALDEIDFYHIEKNGKVICQKGGECMPFNNRQYFDPTYIYRIQLDTQQVSEFYLRIRSRDNLQIPIIIASQETMFESSKIKDYIFGIYAGIMLVMFLYNLFLYITVKDKTYLYYIVYLASVILTQISIQGYSFQYLWPNSPFIAQWSAFLFSPFVGVASAYFMRVFLNTAFYCPKIDKGFIYFNVAYIIAIILAVAGYFNYSYLLITFCASTLSMYMMVAAFIVFKNNYKPARFFLLAWSMFLVGVTIYAMTNLGVLPNNNFTFYTMPLGSAAEVILLSLALADRINVLKKEKEESQAQALLISQQNQKLITEQNIILEQKVHERTIELKVTNDELNVTLTYLKDTQTQLVNAEKMASLGQLTAGIAHEINNPINFVSANLRPLKTGIDEVLEVVAKYEGITSDSVLIDKLKEIAAFKKEIDLDYLKIEIEKLLAGIEDGAKRTSEIVSGLKNFSRLDESDIKEASINEGIESTLILLRSSFSKQIEIVTNLEKVPNIECYPGKLNQVFLNILSNALYAINKKGSSTNNKLIISTFEKEGQIYATFEDSGIGMTPDVKGKIFEPFFTTKNVGEGTGLGMSIVFKIIESHHAHLEVESELGKGTKITIILNKKLN